MKIQCGCGSKFVFDVTPDMATRTVQFACPSCGMDLSAHLNPLIRNELGVTAPPPPPVGRTSTPVATLLTATPVVAATPVVPPPVEIASPPPQRTSASQPPIPPPAPATAPSPVPSIRITMPPPGALPQVGVQPPSPVAAPPSASAQVRIVVPPPSAPIRINTPPPSAPPAPAVAIAASAPVMPPPPSVRIHRAEEKPAAATPDVVDKRFCTKHMGQRVTEQCVVCGKGICPVCMRLFGYLCSPHCKEKAELQGIDVPVYEGQKDVAGAREWRKTGLIIKLSVAAVVLILGTWFWYEWFGSHPKPVFAVRFEDEIAHSGQSAPVEAGQIVFIHGDKLARYDTKTKKQVWLKHIVDKKKIAIEAAEEQKREIVDKNRIEGINPDAEIKVSSVDDIIKDWTRSAEEELELRIQDKNIWVAGDKKLTRYDWDTGEPTKEIPFEWRLENARRSGAELTLTELERDGSQTIRKINLVSGEVTTNYEAHVSAPVVASTSAPTPTNTLILPKPPGKPENVVPAGQLDPQKLAAQLAGAPLPAKIAAPATLSNARNQQRLLNELNGFDSRPNRDEEAESDYREFTSSERSVHGEVFLTEKLVEKKIIVHNAMKAAPKKSALDGPVNVTQSMEVANEILNEMQRDAGLDKVTEDASRYAVRVRDATTDRASAWSGEVTGSPHIYPLKTVNVLCAGKTLMVFDKANRLKWQTMLTYQVSGFGASLDEDNAPEGLGPVVERGNTLYAFDQGVLSAFDMANGNARWRLPSVGVSGLYFDNTGSIYVNTTTASPDKLKFSRQINVNDSSHDVLLKLDEKSGKELWKAALGGALSYLNGKFIYMMASSRSDDEDGGGSGFGMGIDTPSFLRIRRINPKNGRIMWEHFQQRGPLDVKFDKNNIQLVFKKEVQILSYLAF